MPQQFIFKTDSLTKRFGIPRNGLRIPPEYSFDGRLSKQTVRPRIWDDAKYHQNKETGIEYLKQRFDESIDWVCAYIADSDYPKSGEILLSLQNGQWVKYTPAPPATETETYFNFKLWIPVKNGSAKLFFTSSYFGMDDLSFQFQIWKKQNPNTVINGFGQIYGDRDEIFTFGKPVPRFAYFDPKTFTAYYHNTRRAIDVYEF